MRVTQGGPVFQPHFVVPPNSPPIVQHAVPAPPPPPGTPPGPARFPLTVGPPIPPTSHAPGAALPTPVPRPPAPPPAPPAAPPQPAPAAPPPAPPAPPPPPQAGGRPVFQGPVSGQAPFTGQSNPNPSTNPFGQPQIPKTGSIGAFGVRPTGFGGGPQPFDAQYAQNMATFAGGNFFPGSRGTFLNPFANNPFMGQQPPPTLLGAAQNASPFLNQNGFTPQAPSPNITQALSTGFAPTAGGH